MRKGGGREGKGRGQPSTGAVRTGEPCGLTGGSVGRRRRLCGAWVAGRGGAGRRPGMSRAGAGARGPLPVPAAPPVAAGGGGWSSAAPTRERPPRHPAPAPSMPAPLGGGRASVCSEGLSDLNFILCGGPGPSSRRNLSFFFPGNKCLFSPVLTCSCTVVRCGTAW